ncbi:hypothetical protein LNO36_06900 [Klebsiella variicola subsp. variicola]|nr:hypothetical protein [Klebsiella variicola subsp. variicola]
MNDIELAQSLKRRATSANEFGESLYVKADDILALVEALEHYKSREERVTSLVRANSKSWDELYRQVEAKGKRNVELVEALEKAQQRIAELESRTVTVKLASRRLPSDYVDGEFGNDDLAAIHNACLLECKVSVEKYLSAHGIVVKWEAE